MHSGQPRKVKALTKARYVNTFCGLLYDDAGSHVTVLQMQYVVPYGFSVTPAFQYERAENYLAKLWKDRMGQEPELCATLSGFPTTG